MPTCPDKSVRATLNQMTDEKWVELHASDDETWYRNVERDLGLDARPKD